MSQSTVEVGRYHARGKTPRHRQPDVCKQSSHQMPSMTGGCLPSSPVFHRNRCHAVTSRDEHHHFFKRAFIYEMMALGTDHAVPGDCCCFVSALSQRPHHSARSTRRHGITPPSPKLMVPVSTSPSARRCMSPSFCRSLCYVSVCYPRRCSSCSLPSANAHNIYVMKTPSIIVPHHHDSKCSRRRSRTNWTRLEVISSLFVFSSCLSWGKPVAARFNSSE